MSAFPLIHTFDLKAIDSSLRLFSIKFQGLFGGIKFILTNFVNLIQDSLNFLPWWGLLLLVFFLGYKVSKSWVKALIYATLPAFVGFVGFWPLMTETLAITLAAVTICLVLGFPLGVLISKSNLADDLTRPLWDTMQTMPVFVYLIPAIIFFGLGKAPAVIATIIYAVVPIIRLTNHGLRQVNPELIEAAQAFGATSWQTLVKVQIPQAMPTIMTGINQTIMMAVSMVVTCSMIGAGGLGMEVLISVNRIEMGRGLLAGTCVVIVAIVLDRLTQGLKKDK